MLPALIDGRRDYRWGQVTYLSIVSQTDSFARELALRVSAPGVGHDPATVDLSLADAPFFGSEAADF
jgi:hypothetical protein